MNCVDFKIKKDNLSKCISATETEMEPGNCT